MTVSLCIVAYNEEKALPGLLNDVISQTYPKENTEIILIDSGSEDETKNIFLKFAKDNKDVYMNISVLDNPKRSQASGWNTALKNFTGDIIIRVDAHSSVPRNFIENNVKVINSGEYVCGGARPSNIADPTPYKETLLLAESSMFGSSFAGYRRKSEGKKYVSSLFHGAYRREVFEKTGGFNEDLGRTEDNEIHWRIRQNGFRICQSDEIISYQNIRPTLPKMLRQKYENGKWIGLTLGICPKCLSIFHFVPFCFTAAIILCIVLLIIGIFANNTLLLLPMLILGGMYMTVDIIMTLAAIITSERKNIYMPLLIFIFPMLHIVYGIGTIVGIIKLPFWKRNLDGSAEKEIEEVKKCAADHR